MSFDKTLDEMRRRLAGAYYTPQHRVDDAYDVLDASLPKNWREDFVAWDTAAGTGNLVRGRGIKRLYVSTLMEEEVDLLKKDPDVQGECFKFDFLNEALPGKPLLKNSSIPKSFPATLEKDLLDRKKFLFFINPPYATASSGNKKGGNKEGVSDVAVKEYADIGRSKAQLSSLFMFRITEIVKHFGLKNCYFALFNQPLFLTGPSYKKFRKYFFKNWEYKKGFMFPGRDFSGVDADWPCTFTLWTPGKTQGPVEVELLPGEKGKKAMETFREVKKYTPGYAKIARDAKRFYDLDDVDSAKDWVKAPRKMWWGKGVDKGPRVTSAVNVEFEGRGRNVEGSLGYLLCNANAPKEYQLNSFLTKPFKNAHGVYVFKENYRRSTAYFTARTTTKPDWINQEDQFKSPEIKKLEPAEDSASNWVKAPRKMWWGKGDKDVPQLSSAVTVKQKGYCALTDEALGYMCNKGNSVYQNQGGVIWFSGAFSNAHGVSIFPQNFRRCTALFTARAPIKRTWINDKDEYNAPNVSNASDLYEQWVNDSIVYSLFNSKSQQSSLRNIEHKEKTWNIKNEFFWMSLEKIKTLAEKHGYDACAADAESLLEDPERLERDWGSEPYVYEELNGLALSVDAWDVLNTACELVIDSFPYREEADPKYHLQAADAGWYQIRKGILEEKFPERYKKFVEKYKKLEQRLRKGVYYFGFLKP